MLEQYKIIKCNSGRRKAFIYVFRQICGRILGIDKQEEKIRTLHYFLNELVDIKSVPQATGELSVLQNSDLHMLRIFDAICKKHNFSYWLDYGTLLGAVRHGGFIPWDDDLDVAMLREDYERVLPMLKEEFLKYGIDVDERKENLMKRIGVGYQHEKTGIWLDVFPVDAVKTDKKRNDIYYDLCSRMYKYQKFYKKNVLKGDREKLLKKKKELVFSIETISGNNTVLLHGPEFEMPRFALHDKADIFPLKKISFMGYEFFAPNNCDRYLKNVYGNSYMDFPMSGILRHGTDSALHDRGRLNGINMTDVLNLLKEHADHLSEMD